jgi:predicted RNase H-like HicB family nuclease
VELTVEFKDYGRHGVDVIEPRTGLHGHGDTKEEAADNLRVQLWQYLEMHDNYIPAADGPVRTIEDIEV